MKQRGSTTGFVVLLCHVLAQGATARPGLCIVVVEQCANRLRAAGATTHEQTSGAEHCLARAEAAHHRCANPMHVTALAVWLDGSRYDRTLTPAPHLWGA